MTFFSSVGGYYLKKAADSMKGLLSLVANKYFYVGVVLFCIGAGINIYGLRFIPYNIIMPLKSITYIWTILIARSFLNEKINKYKVAGIVTIIIGVILICL